MDPKKAGKALLRAYFTGIFVLENRSKGKIEGLAVPEQGPPAGTLPAAPGGAGHRILTTAPYRSRQGAIRASSGPKRPSPRPQGCDGCKGVQQPFVRLYLRGSAFQESAELLLLHLQGRPLLLPGQMIV